MPAVVCTTSGPLGVAGQVTLAEYYRVREEQKTVTASCLNNQDVAITATASVMTRDVEHVPAGGTATVSLADPERFSSNVRAPSNDDCNDGEICTLAGECTEPDGTCQTDRDCLTGNVCKEDVCVPGCGTDEECEDGFYCDVDAKTCAEGCRDSTECLTGEVCTAGACACNETSCPEGKVCLADTGHCGAPTSCDQIDCGTQSCDPTTLTCIDGCTADSCAESEVCNTQTGLCEINNCIGEDPNQCAGNAQRPVWDPVKCFCAECLSDSDCDSGAGETCNSGGACVPPCQTVCDPGTSGTCGGTTPYCISECCVECVGAADCAAGQLCLDGTCGDAPNCTVDPTVCPAGYTCNNGTCEPPGNPACDPSDPTSCPQGTFCDGGTCQSVGGGFGCGFCNPDCTCDNGLTCDGFLCTGCVPFAGQCPDGQNCIPGEIFGFSNFCMTIQ